MNSADMTLFLREKTEKANRDFCLFDGAEKILVGLSGGADSTALLLVLKDLSEKYGYELSAVHVNHMIRGEEALRDEEFSRSLCEKLGVEFFCERADVPELSRVSGESTELCARNARYEIFEKICRQESITHMATAHNKCDNAETVLFNLARGSGAAGLCGIPPKRELCRGVTLIRPIIYADRDEILEFLQAKGQGFVTDSTNLETDYTRNYLRHEIIPRMKRINPEVTESIMRTSRLVKCDEDYLDSVAQKSLTDDVAKLSQLHESILSRVIIKLFEVSSDETLSENHIKALCEKIYSHDTGKTSVSLPGSMSAVIFRNKLSFEKDTRQKASDVPCFEKKLEYGENFFDESPYALYVVKGASAQVPETLENKEIVYKKYTTDYLYFDTIPDVLLVRNRKNGDKIISGGMTKSVKRILVSSAYSEHDRYLVPFICDGERLLLVPAAAKDDNCKFSGKNECLAIALYRMS